MATQLHFASTDVTTEEVKGKASMTTEDWCNDPANKSKPTYKKVCEAYAKQKAAGEEAAGFGGILLAQQQIAAAAVAAVKEKGDKATEADAIKYIQNPKIKKGVQRFFDKKEKVAKKAKLPPPAPVPLKVSTMTKEGVPTGATAMEMKEVSEGGGMNMPLIIGGAVVGLGLLYFFMSSRGATRAA